MTAIMKCDDHEGRQIYYHIDVFRVMECENKNAKGQYYPTRLTGDMKPRIELSKTADDFTLEHECLHATIDFIRVVQKECFKELFSTDNPFGEEAFIYYYESILKACKYILEENK